MMWADLCSPRSEFSSVVMLRTSRAPASIVKQTNVQKVNLDGGNWRVPNPPIANPLVAERVPWRSSQPGVAGGQRPIIGNPYRFLSHFFCTHLATPVRPQSSLVGKALSATRGLAPGGLGTRQGNFASATTTTESLIWWIIIRCYIQSLFSTSQYRSATTPREFRYYIRCRFGLLLLLLLLPFRWC